jgi:PAS domain S-box-containing protein
LSRSGETVWFHDSASVVCDERGQPNCLQGILLDITERKRATMDLQLSEERYRRLFEICPDAVLIHQHRKIVAINNAGLRMLGASVDSDVLGRSIFEFIHPDFHPISRERTHFALSTMRPTPLLEKKIVRIDGEIRDVEVTAAPFIDGEHISIQVILRDISAHKRANIKLKETSERLRSFALQLDSAIESERMRIARELHDDLGQSLIGVKLELARLQRKLASDRELDGDCLTGFTDVNEIIDGIMDDTRRIVAELRPPALDTLSLPEVIETHTQHFAKLAGLACELAIDRDCRVSDTHALGVFRVLQEALTNIRRHARATRIFVLLKRCPDAIILEIVDDGCGIEKTDQKKLGSYGLMGMHERARQMGGDVEIRGKRSKGTRIRLQIPACEQP